MTQQCPSCGAPREGAIRFCNACGLDYWRAAAGESYSPPPAQDPVVRQPATGSGTGFWLVAAGGALAVIAVVAAVVAVTLPGDAPNSDRSGPAPTPISAENQLIREFFRQARDPDAAFVVRGDGTFTIEGLSQPIPPTSSTAEVRIDGEDWAGSVVVTQEGAAILDARMAYVDGVVFARPAGEDEWTRQALPRAQLGPINPFARISTVTEVSHLGTETVDGVELEHLQVTKWLGGTDFDDLLVNIAITDQSSTLDIWVTDEGIPVTADLVMNVEASDGVETATLRTQTHYVFESWGDVDPISAPT